MSKINGGCRPGAGRKAAFQGEQTKPVRVPESQLKVVLSFLEAYRQRNGSCLTTDERFAYEVEISRLKNGLADGVDFLQTSFRPIPFINHKINALKTVLEEPRPTCLKRNVLDQLQVSSYYSPAGLPWELSSFFKDKKIGFQSKPLIPLPATSKGTDIHQYQLSLQEVDNLIEFLLNAHHDL
ncbi:MAG: hypothetical protein V4525_17205, partial [Pseudomonadota bacterium]